MADMDELPRPPRDVLGQIMDSAAASAGWHARRATKFTVDESIAQWLTDYLRRNVPDAAEAATVTVGGLQGIPLVVDETFTWGQLRIHFSDEEFDDHFVIVPPSYPRFEAIAVQEREQLQWLALREARAFIAYPQRGSWQPLGLVRDVSITPPGL